MDTEILRFGINESALEGPEYRVGQWLGQVRIICPAADAEILRYSFQPSGNTHTLTFCLDLEHPHVNEASRSNLRCVSLRLQGEGSIVNR